MKTMSLRGIRIRTIGIAAALAFGAAPASATADPGQIGQWGALQDYPVVPVSMGVTPDGKIVAWDQANQAPNFGPVPNNGPAMILDPATGFITRSANIAPRQTFCSVITSLPDGRVAIIGGGVNSGSGATTDFQIYDAGSKTFSVAGQMNRKRWYPGATIDEQGNPIVVGGSSQGIERVDQLTGGATLLNSNFPANWYPDPIRTPDGDFLIEDVGDNASQGPGRYILDENGLSTHPSTSQLKARLRGVRALIGPHTFFYNSGGTSTESLVIDASGATPTFTKVASSRFRHMTGQAVTLPTGDVLVVGGNSSGSGTKGTPVMTPELYSPQSDTWTSMDNLDRRRTYHSVSALMPDGRIWAAGSSFDEVQEPNGQFFSPPYLFKQDGSGQPAPRPTATDAPSKLAASETFSVATNSPQNIAHAAFIRLAGTTHQVNAGGAYVKLNTTRVGNRVQMTAPTISEAPPGYYMLFLVDNNGVPSVAPVMQFTESPDAEPQPRVTQSSQYDINTRAWNAFDGDTTQGSGASISRTLSENEPFWQADLGKSKPIDSLKVYLRSDTATDRDLWVFASQNPFTSTSIADTRDQSGVTSYRMQTPSGSIGNAPLDTNARYLRIQEPGSNRTLSLSEVEIVHNEDPTVDLTSPADGDELKAPATIAYAADAGDPDGQIDKVEFFRGSTKVATDTSAPYSASESGVGAGTHQIKARATDDDGAAVDSTTASVTVKVNEAPSVTVTSPNDGATYEAPASYSFTANASDSDGQVTKVEFFRDSTLVGTDTSAPYSTSESDVGTGDYTLTAKATDDDGVSKTSDPVDITVSDPPPPSDPVAAYAFDDGAGLTLSDETGNGHDGDVSGAKWAVDGHSGRALSFDGGDDHVAIADHPDLDLTEAFTIESWIKPRTLAGWKMVLLKEAPPNTLAYGLYASSDSNNRPSSWISGHSAYGPDGTPLNEWSHLATSYDGDTLRLYVNGELVASQTGVPAPQNTDGDLRIGGNSIWSFETLDGLIDDVRIYDSALTEAQIAADRDTPVAPPPPPPPPPTGTEPVLELSFDEGSGNTAADSSGNQNHGTLAGAGWNAEGRHGAAIDLDGSGMVSVADDTDLDLTGTMTLEAYVKPRSHAAWQTVMMKEAPPHTESYALYATGSSRANSNAWVGPNGMDPAGDTPIGEWTHVAFTLEGGVGRMYRDGVLVSSTPGLGAANPTGGAFRIGGNQIWPNEGFDGLIDEVRVWDEALDADQLADGDFTAAAATAQATTAKKAPACQIKRKSGKHKTKPGKCKKKKSKKGKKKRKKGKKNRR